MSCALCHGDIINIKDTFLFVSKTLGKVDVPFISFEECVDCGERLLSPLESDKVLDYIRKKEQEAIDSMPIGNFIAPSEAALILGVTKQAFSKNPKIKRGLIYCKKIGERKFFLKRSVELFKEQGNGKFLLPQNRMYDKSETTKTVPGYTEVKYITKIVVVEPVHEPEFNVDHALFEPNILYGGLERLNR